MNGEIGIVIISGIIAFVVFLFIDSFLFRQTVKKQTLEYRRFCMLLDNVKESMDQIAGPLLTSKVLFPEDEGFYYPEEKDDNL